MAAYFCAIWTNLEGGKVGCCGMAGVFGHEVQNQTMSKDIYDVSWGKNYKVKIRIIVSQPAIPAVAK